MNYIQYLEFVLQTLVSNLKPDQTLLTAAALGTLLHRSAPGITWKTFGKRSLSDLLNDPWFVGKIERCETEKGAIAVSLLIPRTHGAPATIETFNPLRKAMWEAFVLTSPSGHRYVSRIDGSIRLGQEVTPSPADDWVQVQPISNDLQYQWACEFSEVHASQLKSPPEREGWTPHSFSSMLKKEIEPLALLWNRYRSAQVSKVVQLWLANNSLPHELAFQRGSASTPNAKQVATSTPEQCHLDPSSDEIKQILLSALASLPLSELLNLPIPPRLIFEALSKSKAH